MRIVRVAMPGSCGELVQGVIDGVCVHITCPIDRFSTAIAREAKPGTVEVGPVSRSGLKAEAIGASAIASGIATTGAATLGSIAAAEPQESEGNTASLDKTKKAVRALIELGLIEREGHIPGVSIEIKSELPAGKGMASSTADIGAALFACARLLDIPTTVHDVANVALSIEPTDGTLFEGIVRFGHIKGDMLEEIGEAPPLDVVVLEPPGAIDTVLFNKVRAVTVGGARASGIDTTIDTVDRSCEKISIEAIEMATDAIKRFDLRLLGQAVVLSARLNQQILYKPELEDVIAMATRRGALGVNVAHSGTVFGILVESGFAQRLFDRISHYIPGGWNAYTASIVSGGPRDEERSHDLRQF